MTSDVSPGPRRALKLLWACGLAGLAAFVLHVTVGLGEDLTGPFQVLYVSLHIVAAAIFAVRAVVTPTERRSWSIVAVGMLSWAAGYSYYFLALSDREVPYPSLADGFWLTLYVAAFIGVVTLLRAGTAAVPRSVWVDGLIGAVATAAVAAALLFEPILESTGGRVGAITTRLAYPLADVLLLGLVLAVFALYGWRPGRRWLIIGGVFAAQAVVDSIYLYRSATDGYVAGTILDAGWPALALMLAYAAWQRPTHAPDARLSEWSAMVVPAFLTLVAMSLFVYDLVAGVTDVAFALATATFVLGSLRTAKAFSDMDWLSRGRTITRAVMVAVVVTALTAAALVVSLQSRAHDAQRAATLAVEQTGLANRLDGLAAHATADVASGMTPNHAELREVADVDARMSRGWADLERLDVDSNRAGRLRELDEQLKSALDGVIEGARAGDAARAERAHERMDPRYARLRTSLSQSADAYSARAATTGLLADVGSIAVMLAVGGAFGLLLLSSSRQRLARVEAEREQHALAGENQRLVELERTKEKSDRRAAARHAAARAVAGSATLDEAAPRILGAVCEALDWELGAMWMVDREAGVMRLHAEWAPSPDVATAFNEASRALTFAHGVGMPGTVWASKQPRWIADVAEDGEFVRSRVAEELAIHAAFGFPVLAGEDLVGAIEFFSREVQPPDEELLGTMASIGSYLGEFIERKRTEEQLAIARDEALQASRMKSHFLANMSHEIRTPMNGVIGMTELLLDSQLTGDQRKYAETVRFSGEALLGVINDVLDFSKIEAGKLELDETAFDLRDSIDDVCDLLAERAHSKGLELASLVADDVPLVVRGDRARLQQVLTNLLSNAVKFTDHGEVLIRVDSTAQAEGEPAIVRFEVVDTGIGIEPSEVEGLFESFSQADASTTRQYGGTGLGLTIARQLTEIMGGELSVESEPGGGSTFRFSLPLETTRANGHAVTRRLELAGLRVLVVDDNATNRLVVERQLASWAMEFDSASSGRQALRQLQAATEIGNPYDLALLDFQMPGMDGLELARAIRGDDRLESLPLLLLTSSGDDRAAAEEAGVTGYLSKPVRQSRLLDSIATAMAPQMSEERGGMAEMRSGQNGHAQPPSSNLSRHVAEDPARRSGRSLLVAEDNAVNQAVAMLMLEQRGFEVDLAVNGREAVDRLSEGDYAAVFMDCQMPELDGYQATAEIRSLSGPRQKTPIIAMTAHSMEGDREKCLAAGMDDYLSKPLRGHHLDEVLRRWIPGFGIPTTPGNVVSPPGAASRSGASPSGAVEGNGNGAGAPSDGAIDRSALLALGELGEGDGSSLLSELIGLFLVQTPPQLAAVRRAVEEGNADALREAAHALRGSSVTIGALRMTAICRELEALASAGELMPTRELASRLEGAFAEATAELEPELTPPENTELTPG